MSDKTENAIFVIAIIITLMLTILSLISGYNWLVTVDYKETILISKFEDTENLHVIENEDMYEMRGMDGETIKLDGYRDHVLIVVSEETPSINKYYKMRNGKIVDIIETAIVIPHNRVINEGISSETIHYSSIRKEGN